MLDIKKLLLKVLKSLALEPVTLTYTSNSYVNSTNFGYIKAYKLGNIVLIMADVRPSTSLPSNSTWVNIGKLPYTPAFESAVTLPSQANVNARILFDVSTSSNIRIYNSSGTATGTNYFKGVSFVVISA